MPIEAPPPITIMGRTIGSGKPLPSPRETLKTMLEESAKKESGLEYKSPLSEVDPASLDELLNRIDSGALALGQVPDPKDVEKLVAYYWSLCETFNREAALGLTVKPKRNKSTSQDPGQSAMESLL